MTVVGILDGKLCILLEGPRVFLTPTLGEGDMYEINQYEKDLPVFSCWDEMECAAWGIDYKEWLAYYGVAHKEWLAAHEAPDSPEDLPMGTDDFPF